MIYALALALLGDLLGALRGMAELPAVDAELGVHQVQQAPPDARLPRHCAAVRRRPERRLQRLRERFRQGGSPPDGPARVVGTRRTAVRQKRAVRRHGVREEVQVGERHVVPACVQINQCYRPREYWRRPLGHRGGASSLKAHRNLTCTPGPAEPLQLEAGVPADLTGAWARVCLLYTSPSPRDRTRSRMPSSA